jgi:hypothetical protein
MVIIGILFIIIMTIYFGVVVFQGKFASKVWLENIENGNQETIEAAVQQAFESWRRPKKNDNIPIADWSSIETMEIMGVTKEKCRVSIVSGPDIRIIEGSRKQIGDSISVASRSAIMLAERLFFEVPFLMFNVLQIDVYELPTNSLSNRKCVLTTQINRDQANATDWDSFMDEHSMSETLLSWNTKIRHDSIKQIDPEINAVLN